MHYGGRSTAQVSRTILLKDHAANVLTFSAIYSLLHYVTRYCISVVYNLLNWCEANTCRLTAEQGKTIALQEAMREQHKIVFGSGQGFAKPAGLAKGIKTRRTCSGTRRTTKDNGGGVW